MPGRADGGLGNRSLLFIGASRVFALGSLSTSTGLSALVGSLLGGYTGITVRYRLNRDGDHRLNRARTIIVIMRMRTDRETRVYVDRRRGKGHCHLDRKVQLRS